MGDISHETSRPLDGERPAETAAIINPLADELMAIAVRLRLAATEGGTEGSGTEQSPREPRSAQRPSHSHLALARKAYALRRKRGAIFGNPDLFGEPAWDILLDLFIARAEGKSVSVSSACIGSAAPATTGLRWLGVLADEGLILREPDPEDNRRVMVRLTTAGCTAMERFFDAAEKD
ncbi:MarR family winged helix-turn-helix transcriptional regulator [Porphyrobacter sp. YT40]|uniref:MarR family winged helix-turn-helix transcriptional regulator n=1 Tax=Porphyrobacter sp. YT40 TaxID=2547601 RepID=UPI0015E8A67E|nr:MarR family winged helix-turn-helix transcriptional regulator [Porphyrobacter sp. YT40]